MQANIYKNPIEFINLIKNSGNHNKLAALDIGDKKIGIAIAGLTLLISTPHSIYVRQNFEKDLTFIKNFIIENFICGLIIGLPLSTLGESTTQSQKIIDYVTQIKNRLNIPIFFEDETYTTKLANDKLIEVGLNRKQRNKIDDKFSAMIILEAFIDKV